MAHSRDTANYKHFYKPTSITAHLIRGLKTKDRLAFAWIPLTWVILKPTGIIVLGDKPTRMDRILIADRHYAHPQQIHAEDYTQLELA
jgi:hypothetical protein